MAVLIDVISDDDYLSELLRLRLAPMFPNAYIARRGSSLCEELRDMCDSTICLYDNRTYKPDEPNAVPVFGSGKAVDCNALGSAISSLMSDTKPEVTVTSLPGRSHILLPFTYINERESMIENMFSPFSSDSDLTVRIDLMSGLRMPSSGISGSDNNAFDSLLQRAGKRDFSPADILEYCNPDMRGFMTPGRPAEPDNVFDHDKNTLISLLKGLRGLSSTKTSPTVTTLSVIEGFRLADTCELIKHADNIHILLPSDDPEDSSGLSKIPPLIERSMERGQKIFVHYSEEYKKGMPNEARSI